jgi:hypothetical protein
MTEERKKIIAKARKLNELAKRGVDGEKENAQSMLKMYVEKHKITDKELNDSTTDYSSLLDMSDTDFMNEMIKDFIPMGIGLIFSRFTNNNNMKSQSNKEFNQFIHKFSNAMNERAINITKPKNKH